MVEVFWLGKGRKRCRLVIADPPRGQFILGSPLHTVASPALVLPSDRLLSMTLLADFSSLP